MHNCVLLRVCGDRAGRGLIRLKIMVTWHEGACRRESSRRNALVLLMFEFFAGRTHLWIAYIYKHIYKIKYMHTCLIFFIKICKRIKFQFLGLSQRLKLTLQGLFYSCSGANNSLFHCTRCPWPEKKRDGLLLNGKSQMI
jgi:hypothetical protein